MSINVSRDVAETGLTDIGTLGHATQSSKKVVRRWALNAQCGLDFDRGQKVHILELSACIHKKYFEKMKTIHMNTTYT